MWWLLSGVILAVMGWGILSARRVLYPERRVFPPPNPLPPYTATELTAPDGASFEVWRLHPLSPRARLLLFHGYYANRYQILGLAERLRQRGYDVVLCELRGHGDRPGPCTLGIKETVDAGTVLEWARSLDGPVPLPVGVLGFSLGASVACQVADIYPEVRAVVVDSIYSRFFPVLARSIRQQYHLPAIPWAWVSWWGLQLMLHRRLSSIDPASLAPRLRQPLFAIQGGEDRRVAPLLGREFYQRWAGPKERWFEPQAPHVGIFARHPEEYGDRVASFFDRTLG